MSEQFPGQFDPPVERERLIQPPLPLVERMERMRSTETLGLQPGIEHGFHPDYALLPVQEGWNWPKLLTITEELNGWEPGCDFKNKTLIAYRSVRSQEADAELLDEVDWTAFQDAMLRAEDNLSFHLYVRGYNLSMCFWNSYEDAIKASESEAHKAAMRMTMASYDEVILERHRVSRVNGVIDMQLVSARQVLGQAA